MWAEETGNSILAKGWTKLTSCILNNCIFSVVKYFVVSTTLPSIIFLFDKEGKPSKYITIGRKSLKFLKPSLSILHLRSITYYIEKGKGKVEIQGTRTALACITAKYSCEASPPISYESGFYNKSPL